MIESKKTRQNLKRVPKIPGKSVTSLEALSKRATLSSYFSVEDFVTEKLVVELYLN